MLRRVPTIINGKAGFIMEKAGRKPREGVGRYEGGRILRADQGETEAQAMETAMRQRLKIGASKDNFRASDWGHPLGQLRMMAIVANSDGEGLSDRQYTAIKHYVLKRAIYRASQGYPAEHPRSIAAELVSRGIDLARIDDDEEEAAKKARDYSAARRALLDYAARGVVWCRMIDGLARDEPQPHNALGEIRSAANVLVRHFGM